MFQKNIVITGSLLFVVLGLGLCTAEARTPQIAEMEEAPETAFMKMIPVPAVDVVVPTVVEVPIGERVWDDETFLVKERATGRYIGSYLSSKTAVGLTPVSVSSVPNVTSVNRLNDGKLDTFTDFDLPAEGVGQVSLTLSANSPITSSQLRLRLAQYVALPLTVQVQYQRPGEDTLQTAVATTRMTGTTVTFPEVTATRFVVTFTYGQPLRITELSFDQKNAAVTEEQRLRFLLQPGEDYDIYYDADRSVRVSTSEVGNLYNDKEVLLVYGGSPRANQLYVPADSDGDGVRDTFDNCVQMSNEDQVDIDGNGRGDVCDDWDRDGRLNSADNCVNEPNRDQRDEDHDGIGDVCDEEESRFTEANPWVPWVGIGFAGLVLLLLFTLVAKRPAIQAGEEKREGE